MKDRVEELERNMMQNDDQNSTGKINNQKDVKAINANTFVVELKSYEKKNSDLKLPIDSEELSPIPNLLQLVQGGNKNKFHLIKSIGNHKILLNKKSTLKVHAKPTAGNKITIITPNKFGSPPIIKKISSLPQKLDSKSAMQSLSITKLQSDGKENHKSPSSFKINKNMIFSTGNQSLGSNSKFTFNLETFSIKREFLERGYESKSTPIHISIPNLQPSSPNKSIDENLVAELPDIDEEYLKDDGELTNLSWLCNGNNLMKELPFPGTDEFGLFSDDEDFDKSIKTEKMSPNHGIFTATSKITGSTIKYPTKCEPNTEFNPNGKPPYSFSCLIFMAIEDSTAKKLPVKAIYHWVCKHFPYFNTAPPGWKNSIRHNLSLNKCFKKADMDQRAKDPTKGSLWCIDPAYRPNLIQALKRTPFYPYIHPSGIGQPLSLSNLANLLPGAQSGRIPLWSPNLTTKSPLSDADPDVASAALNLLNLKSKDDKITNNKNIRNTIKELQREILGRKGFWPCPWNSLSRSDSLSSLDSSDDGIIVSRDSSDDHNYTQPFKYLVETHETPCSPESDKSAPDAAYEFETGGTDEEEFLDDVDHDEIISTDSDDDLTDSGFGTKRKYEIKHENMPSRKRKTHQRLTVTPPKKSKVSDKQDKTPKKIKIKMGPRSTKKVEIRNNKRQQKNTAKVDSDVDSGKDSPKVVRSRSFKRKLQSAGNEYKKMYNTNFMRHRERGIYSTRSSSITRSSTRLAGKHSPAPKRISRRRTSAPSNDDEEIKLAAGSLMHLAGFKSPSTAVS